MSRDCWKHEFVQLSGVHQAEPSRHRDISEGKDTDAVDRELISTKIDDNPIVFGIVYRPLNSAPAVKSLF